MRLAVTFFFSAILTLPALAEGSLQVIRGQTMGTSYSIKFQSPQPLPNLQQQVDSLLEKVNNLASTYRPNSQISLFNRSKSRDWYSVDPLMAKWSRRSLEIGAKTGNAFDITVGMLVNLWGFGPKAIPRKVPEKAAIAAYLQAGGPGSLKVRSQPPALKKRQDSIAIDLSGIAKGAGVDEVALLLESQKIGNYLVEIGGEIRSKGYKGAKQKWALAIEKPDPRGRRIQKIIHLQAAAMATSGDYRNYFEDKGQRYSHLLDPRTGYPIKHNLASVTVIADNCMDADAFATAFMVLGFEQAKLVAEREGLAAFFILREGANFRDYMTKSFSQYLVK